MWRIFPLGLHLSGRKCVVIGGGPVATRRVHSLVEGEADILVVAPEVSAEIDALGQAGKIRVALTGYFPEALQGAFLAVVATSDEALNTRVSADARAAGCLVNDADEPERGDCLFPSVVRRGELVISVTTGGASPSLAMRIRDALEAELGAEYEEYVSLLGEVRREVLSRIPDGAGRKRALSALAADADILGLIRDGRMDEARAKAYACISLSSD